MLLPLLIALLHIIFKVFDALNWCANQSYRLMVSVLHSGEMATPSPSQAQLNSYLSCDLTPVLLPLLTVSLYMIFNVADALNWCANQSYRLMVSDLHSGKWPPLVPPKPN